MKKITKNKISLRGRILHFLIRVFMDLPMNKKTGFLENSARLSRMKRLWIIPIRYELKRHKVDDVPFEELVYKKKNNNKVILQFHGGAYVMRFFD